MSPLLAIRNKTVSKFLHVLTTAVVLGSGAALWLYAQDQGQATFHVKVDMVVLTFAATDGKGKYVNGIKPKDIKVYEDDIQQKLATFAEGNRPPLQVLDNGETRPL